MNDGTLIRELKKIYPSVLYCRGCDYGYEYDCTTRGCAIVNQVADRLEACDYAAMRSAIDQVEKTKRQLSDVVSILGCSDIDCLKELSQAEKDGRLVVLPCKLGDTVWCISGTYKTISQYTVAGYLNDGFRWKARITKKIPSWIGNKTEHKYVAFNSFGKTVFLTHEEADAALKKERRGLTCDHR